MLSWSWNSTTATNGAHVLTARAVDLAGNTGTSPQVNVTVSGGTGGGGGGGGGTPVTATFTNEDANDGYVKAAATGTSPPVGTLESSLGLAIGRGTDGKFNRSLLSFDTSSIPDTATVLSAKVTVTYRSASGDPWNDPAGNTLVIDVNTGCIDVCTIGTPDWAATVTAPAAAQLTSFTGGTQTSSLFSAAGLSAVNRTGRTQLRLRFSANQAATNYLWIGNAASATLTVTYQP